MNLHEFQAKQLFRVAGIPVPQGLVVDTPSAAVEAARHLGGKQWIVKAQIHAGARADAGGIRRLDELQQVQNFAQTMLGERLITAENAPPGQLVNQLLIEAPCSISNIYYFCVTLDADSGRIIFQGGVVEHGEEGVLNSRMPKKSFQVEIDPSAGLQHFQSRKLAVELGLAKSVWKSFFEITRALYQLFIEKDLLLIEINSLVDRGHGQMMALDARVQVDDNALIRQPCLAQLEDDSQDGFHDAHIMGNGLGFIAMEGDIGCIVNGSGLALATLDMIQMSGGRVANIVDVGDGVGIDELAKACKFIWNNGHCKSILINVVGGIVRCDTVAMGVIEGVRKYHIRCPIIVRMEGTQVEEARVLFMQSGQKIDMVKELDIAVKTAVEAASL